MTWFDDQPTFQLVWPDGGALAGLVIDVRASSTAADVAVERFCRRVERGRMRQKDVARLAAVFVEHVEAWTVTAITPARTPGRVVPVAVSRFLALDRRVVAEVLRQWMRAVQRSALPAEPAAEVEPVEPGLSIEDFIASTTLTEPSPGAVLVESAA
jgi:hypothetical protein